ncbi:MAG: DNA polymerase III subunit gamma/tau [Myxococcales bacterium]|nr:DNA polymerase III subunit gamma/tau [Myxococcales bacterium]
MSYVVLARKWRPQSFDDLVGQGHVARTLANAIATGRVAHAFLFTGVRGVGKTTSARILAKALNCEVGPTATPCLKCNPCREIGDGTAVDVREIDAASYTGIDDVRKLQEGLPYRPARDRYKIFIVDEVHMLSTAAWNAFLKTLEEPPPHVKFIFATTAVNKVPDTILSRCQRFDFKLVKVNDIAGRLRQVLEAEGISADDESLRILAREAAGSMRDAMSLLDQVIAWSGAEALSGEAVARVLGVADASVLHGLSRAVLRGDAAQCLTIVGQLATFGYGLGHVARDFLAELRALVVAHVSPDAAELLSLPDAELRELLDIAKAATAEDLSRLYLGFSRAFDDVTRSSQPRAELEMALVRLARRPPLVAVDELLARLHALERRVSGAASSEPKRPERGDPRAQAAGPARPMETPLPKVGAGHDPARGSVETILATPREPAPSVAPVTRAEAAMKAEAPALIEDAAKISVLDEPSLASWRRIVAAVACEQPHLGSMLDHGAPVEFVRGRVVVAFAPGSFLAEQLKAATTLEALERAASACLFEPTVVVLDLSGMHGGVASLASLRATEEAARKAEARQSVAENAIVRAAIEMLGAELRDVRLPTSG